MEIKKKKILDVMPLGPFNVAFQIHRAHTALSLGLFYFIFPIILNLYFILLL